MTVVDHMHVEASMKQDVLVTVTNKVGAVITRNSQGQLHNPNGPAVIHPDGEQVWFFNDALTRSAGPAVICPDGTHEWWFDDVMYPFNEYVKAANLPDDVIVELKLEYGA